MKDLKRVLLITILFLGNLYIAHADDYIPANQLYQENIVYTYETKGGKALTWQTKVRFWGDGLKLSISRGRCAIVLSKSSNLDDTSTCYYYQSGRQISISQNVERSNIFPEPSMISFQILKGFVPIANNNYKAIISDEKITIPDGKYYQYLVLSYNSNPAGRKTIIKESRNRMINVVNGALYAIDDSQPEPEKKFDLSVESIKVTPTSNYIDGDVKASVTIKNNGNKTANNCCVRFFLSKYNSVYKPYQYSFSTVFKLGSLDAGASITHEETLYFLSQSFASPGSYYIIADVYSSGAEKQDADDSNNQKATPFTVKSSKSLNIINERSFIRINNITEEDLGNTIYITGSNARSIKQIPINTTGEMMITNQWSDPILFITIVNKDGTKEDLKMNNTK